MRDNTQPPEPAQAPRRKWRTLRFFAYVSAALFGLVLFPEKIVFAQTARLPTDCPRIVPQPVNWIVRVECNHEGKPQYIEHKWPFGSPDNIKSIRVPWGYRHLIFGPSVGAQLTNNGHKPSVERGYGDMHIWALLPDVTPHDQRNPPVMDSPGEFDLVKINVTPVVNKAYPIWDGQAWFLRGVPNRLDHLKMGPGYPPYGAGYRDIPLINKKPRFGLNRIGPERVIIDPTYDKNIIKPGAPPYNDLWFDGEAPEKSSLMIVCGSDFRRNGELDPENNPRTLCHHEFAHNGLNAAVRLTYWKKNHEYWRNIQDRVTALLNSLKTDTKTGE